MAFGHVKPEIPLRYPMWRRKGDAKCSERIGHDRHLKGPLRGKGGNERGPAESEAGKCGWESVNISSDYLYFISEVNRPSRKGFGKNELIG